MSLYDDLLNAGLPVVSATDMLGKPRQATFSRTLDDAENEIYLNLLFPHRQEQIARYNAARATAYAVEQLRSVTADQAANYVNQQITGGTPEATALAAFDAATTLAAMKPILRNMLVGMYRTVDILKLIVRMLVAFRDYLMSDLQD